MSHLPSFPFGNPPKAVRRTNTLYLVFVTVFLVAIAALLVFAECWHLTLSQFGRMTQAQIAAHKAEMLLKTDTAKIQYDDLLRSLRRATNVLWEVLFDQQQVRAAGRGLQTNEDGRILAQDERLARTARFLFRTEFPPLLSDTEVIEHLEATRRQEWDVLHAVGTSYIPDDVFLAAVKTNVEWAKARRALVDDVKGLLRSLVRESETKLLLTPLPPDSPTLQEAFASLDAQDAADRLKAFDEIRQQAETGQSPPASRGNRRASTAQAFTNGSSFPFHDDEKKDDLPPPKQTKAEQTIKQGSRIASINGTNPTGTISKNLAPIADKEGARALPVTDGKHAGTTSQSASINAGPIRSGSLADPPCGWHIGSAYPRKQLVVVENGQVHSANAAITPTVSSTAAPPASLGSPTAPFDAYLAGPAAQNYYIYSRASSIPASTPSRAPIAYQPVVWTTTPARVPTYQQFVTVAPPGCQLVRIR